MLYAYVVYQRGIENVVKFVYDNRKQYEHKLNRMLCVCGCVWFLSNSSRLEKSRKSLGKNQVTVIFCCFMFEWLLLFKLRVQNTNKYILYTLYIYILKQ